MTSSDLDVLRASVDSTLRMTFADGEVVTAKIASVSDDEKNVINDIVDSNRPDKYPDGYAKAAYLARFEEIVSVQRTEN